MPWYLTYSGIINLDCMKIQLYTVTLKSVTKEQCDLGEKTQKEVWEHTFAYGLQSKSFILRRDI